MNAAAMLRLFYTILLATAFLSAEASGLELSEHRLLGDSVYAHVLEVVGSGLPIDLDDSSFGELCAARAEGDMSRDRFHERGKSILEQLSRVSARQIQDAIDSGRHYGGNVVSLYLQHHLRALHLAARSDLSPSMRLERALQAEAYAQGYLADAFSSGHMLVPLHGALAFLIPRNHVETHNHYCHQGVYVINADGAVWQAFGDGLLHAHLPSYRAVLAACQTSLMETLLVWSCAAQLEMSSGLERWADSVCGEAGIENTIDRWHSVRDGDGYLHSVRLPTLMELPMPIAATWSVRTDERHLHGIRVRHHYPQLREDGLHDPDQTDIDLDFLYSRSAVPDWMVPEQLRFGQSEIAAQLIKSDPDWASVRWVQKRLVTPSYKGLLVHLGGQLLINSNDTRHCGLVGLGYGIWDDLLLIKDVSISATLMPSFYEPRHRLLILSGGFGVAFPGKVMRTMRFDIGPAVGLSGGFNDVGTALSLGLGTRVFRTVLGDAGVSWRFKYQWFSAGQSLSGPVLEMIWQ